MNHSDVNPKAEMPNPKIKAKFCIIGMVNLTYCYNSSLLGSLDHMAMSIDNF